MHHHATMSFGAWVFLLANLTIAAGYGSTAMFVLPRMPLPRIVKVFGGGLFAGCMGTHIWMACEHHDASVFWTVEHVVQAACTWGFVVTFGRALRSAQRRQRVRSTPDSRES